MAYETVEEDYTIPERTEHRKRVVARVCDKCGEREEADGKYGEFDDPMWIPISVEAGETGEEGWNELERVFCGDCVTDVLFALGALGFQDHHHGSTNLLEDVDCPGAGNRTDVPRICPTPSKGPYDEDDDDF